MKQMLVEDPPSYYARFSDDWQARVVEQLDPFCKNAPLQLQAVEVAIRIVLACCGKTCSSPSLPPRRVLVGLCDILTIAGESCTQEALRGIDAISALPEKWDKELFLTILSALLVCCERVAPSFMWAPYDSLERLVMAHAELDPLDQSEKVHVVERVLVPSLIVRLTSVNAILTTAQAEGGSSKQEGSMPSVELQAILCRVLKASLEMLPTRKLSPLAPRIFAPLQSVVVTFNTLNASFRSTSYGSCISRETAFQALNTINVILENTTMSETLTSDLFPDLARLLAGSEDYQENDEEGDMLIIEACELLQQVAERTKTRFTLYVNETSVLLFNILSKRPPPSIVHAPIIETFAEIALQLGRCFQPLSGATTDMLRAAVELVWTHAQQVHLDDVYEYGIYDFEVLNAVSQTIQSMVQGSREGGNYLGTPFLDMVIAYAHSSLQLSSFELKSEQSKHALEEAATVVGEVSVDESLRPLLVKHLMWQGSKETDFLQGLLDTVSNLGVKTENTAWAANSFIEVKIRLPLLRPPELAASFENAGVSQIPFQYFRGTAPPNPAFSPTTRLEMEKDSQYGTHKYWSISMMSVYRDMSPEELRYQDWMNGVQGGAAGPHSGPSSPPTQASATFEASISDAVRSLSGRQGRPSPRRYKNKA